MSPMVCLHGRKVQLLKGLTKVVKKESDKKSISFSDEVLGKVNSPTSLSSAWSGVGQPEAELKGVL